MGDLAGQALGEAMGRDDELRKLNDAEITRSRREVAFGTLLDSVGVALGAGVGETPGRAARAWADLTSGYAINPDTLLKTFPGEGYDEMVVVKAIPFHSLCEHHLLPFHGTASIGYIPNGEIVGLSKIPRLVHAYSRRLQVQERLTRQIADTLERCLKARGVIVVMEAEHLCMTMRGVGTPGRTTTSVVRGLLKEDSRARSEAFAILAA